MKMGNLLLDFVLIACVFQLNYAKLPDAGLTTPELVNYWGYPIESYEIQTKDGYILTLHRVPHGKEKHSPRVSNKKKPVFFLLHGMLGTSASFFLNLPHQSLGYMLADAGFDVWLGNTRGNRYSQRHVTLDSNNTKFWDYTFDEMADYDFPAMIDYVLNKTNEKQLHFLGYSQGNTIAFAALSDNQELQKKIKINFALGPVTRIRYVNDFLTTIASYDSMIISFFKLFNVLEVAPTSKAWNIVTNVVCTEVPMICDVFYSFLAGVDMNNHYNKTRMALYATYIPSGTSSKNIIHYLQMVNSKVFRRFDYRTIGNVEHYNAGVPPLFDIRKISTPTVLISSNEDIVATPKDVKWTGDQLQNVISRIHLKDLNHLELVWAPSAKTTYERIINMAKKG